MDIDPNVIISSIAVVIAVIGVSISAYLTRQSNELVRKDMKVRLRPWIKLEGCVPAYGIYANKKTVKWDIALTNTTENIASVRMVASFTNIGSIPCHLVSRFVMSDSMIERNTILNEDMKKNTSVIIMPNETICDHMDIDFNRWQKKSSTPLFMGLGIIYTVTDTLESQMGRVWEFYQGGNTIRDDVYEEKNR